MKTPPMKTLTRGLLAALLCALATPAFAGIAYVPLSTATEGVNGISFDTQLWATNLGTVDRRFDLYFIATETDGTNRSGEVVSFTVPGGVTMRIDDLVATNGHGLLEVSGAPQIALRAQVTPSHNGIVSLGTTLPIVTDSNVIAADTKINVQGWERSAIATTDFVLVNVGDEGAECRVEVLRANGEAVLSPTVLQLAPLTQRQFSDVLGLLNQLSVKDIRAEVSCSQPFYAYSLVTDPSTGEVRVLPPTAELSSSFETTPGPGPPGGPGPGECATGSTCFNFEGNFFTPSFQEPVRRIEMTVPPGVYRKAHLNMDVLHGGWQNPSSGLHNLFWFVFNRNRDMLGYMNFRGPNQNSILIRHGFNLSQPDKPRIELPFQPVPGQSYNIDYLWDAAAGRIDVTVSHDGQVVARMFGVPNINQISVGGGDRFLIDISFLPGVNPNEPPTYGWRYSNLNVEFAP